jgi:hypothetical protein
MMTTTDVSAAPLSTVMGVFTTRDQADRAIDGLREAHFSYDHIRIVERGTGSFTDTLKGMFTGQTVTASSGVDNLINMGMPEYEAQHYQRYLDTDFVLLIMNADDRPEDAFSIMRHNGAFDINLRLRLSLVDDDAGDDEAVEAEEVDVDEGEVVADDEQEGIENQPIGATDATSGVPQTAPVQPVQQTPDPVDEQALSSDAQNW